MEQKIAVVVGSAGGIGGECVSSLLNDGWNIFGLDIQKHNLRAERKEHTASFEFIRCDVSDSASVRDAFSKIAEKTNRVHALICCSGIIRVGPLDTMSEDAFDEIFSVNVRGSWMCAKAAIPFLERAAEPLFPSRLIFLSSVAAFRPKLSGGAYSATKAALEMIMRAFAGELVSRGILANAIAPGPVDTPFVKQIADPSTGYKAGGSAPIPSGRISSPSDVVSFVRFLLSDNSTNVVGAVLACDGGISAVRS